MKTPFKVMTAAAIAGAVAVPAAATPAAAAATPDAIAFEMDGEVTIVQWEDFVDAIAEGEGDLYDYVMNASPHAVSVEEGQFIEWDDLVDAIVDAEEGTESADVLEDLAQDENTEFVPEESVNAWAEYGVDPTVSIESVSAINASTLEVDFNQDLDADELTALEIEVTRDGSTQLFEVADTEGDKVHLVRTNDADLQAGDYTVTVNGLGDEALTATTTVDAQVATTLDINASNLTDNNPKAKIGISLADQYGDELELQQSDFTVTAFNQTQDQSVNVQFDSADDYYYVDTAAVAEDFKVGDEVSVTFLHEDTGLKATKTLTVVKGSQLDSVSLGEVMLPEDTNLLTEELEDVKIPYTAMDQYGNDVELSSSNVEVISSNENIVMESDVSFTTEDDEPVLNIAKFGEAGTVTLTLLNKVNGETATVTLEVNEQAGTPYAVSLDQTSVEVAANGSQTLDLTVTDKYGNEVDPADYVGSGFTVVSSNESVATAKIDNTDDDMGSYGDVIVDAKGTQGQTATITVTLNSTGDSVTSDVTIGEAATPFNIEVADDSDHSNSLVVGGTTTVDFSVFDQYENNANDDTQYEVRYSFESDNGSDYLTLGESMDSDISDASLDVTADAAGSATVVASLVDTSNGEDEVLDEVEVPFTTVSNSAEIFDYEVADIPELYKNGDDDGDLSGEVDTYAEKVSVNATDEDGNTLSVPQSSIISVTSLSEDLVVDEVDGTWYVAANDQGDDLTEDTTGNIRVSVSTDEGTQNLEKTVTISGEDLEVSSFQGMSETTTSDDAEVVTSFDVDDYDSDISFNEDGTAYLWTTDQFGVTSEYTLTSDDTVNISNFNNIEGAQGTTPDTATIDVNGNVDITDNGDTTAVGADASYRLTLIESESGLSLDFTVRPDEDSN